MKLPITACFFLFTIISHSQESLYMPIEFKKAYQNKTRSFTGKPGENYWQNSIVYNIDVEVIPNSWDIIGKQTVIYTNNSNDSLHQIYIKMHTNHYKKGGLRANEVPIENLTNGMQIHSIQVNDISVEFKNINKSTNLAPENIDKVKASNQITITEKASYIRLNLKEPIAPKSKTTISLGWKTQMPSIYVNRMGAYDTESAFVGYWYPQIAVYEDIDGWDDSEYTGAQEYYTDYSDYHVNVTVPSSYHIAATGKLLNPEVVFDDKTLKKYKASKKSKNVITIIDGRQVNKERNTKKTWQFKAKNVRDFAFGLSNNFKWIGQAIQLDSKTIASNLIYDVKDEKYAEGVLETQKKV